MKILFQSDHTLEFRKIIEHISIKCVSELGKARILNSQPFSDLGLLQTALTEVSEAKKIYMSENGLPIWAFDDVRSLLNRIEPLESYLEIKDCQKVLNFLEVSSEIKQFLTKNRQVYPLLANYAQRIDPLLNVAQLLRSTIDPSGQIYDNASPDLKSIRSQIAVLSKQINIKLERIIKKQKEHLQEDYITLRDGRLVIPVREFSVNKIPGIVHGQSATGQTSYIEPMSVVSLNNEIFELYNREKREIVRILKRLSATFRDHATALYSNQESLVQIDALQAKAQYSITVEGEAPDINEEFKWDIRNGSHPLLLMKIGKRTVPLNLKIGSENRMLVITGPNAGGKTVALKTIGLLQLLFQSGFHVPVDEGSQFPMCVQLAAVIGDEQSIENDLSTFSSHIKKLNHITNELEIGALVLIDEVGTGTDPAEGSALAISFLEKLNRPGVMTLVTTHLGNLKTFAQKTDHVINAAMQFNFESLSPLFKLEVGIPGSSYAFDISHRLGVSKDILQRARSLLGGSHDEFESMIADLSKKIKRYDQKLGDLSIKESAMEGLKSLYHNRSEDLKKNRKQYEHEAQEKAREILETVNKTIEQVVREIRESQAAPHVLKHSREKIAGLKQKLSEKANTEQTEKLSAESLQSGQYVYSRRFEIKGQIIKINRAKEQAEIDADGLKLTVPFSDIALADNGEKPEVQNVSTEISSQVSNELDLRGKIGEEALAELDQYLDLAINSSWQQVRIIHGKGTGALRQKVQSYLKKNRRIKSYRLGKVGEGDTGVTVVEL